MNSSLIFDTAAVNMKTFDGKNVSLFHELWCEIANDNNAIRVVLYFFILLHSLQYYAECRVSIEMSRNQLEWTQMCHMCTVNTDDIVCH